MERMHFKTTIDASRERVWEILWGEQTYPQWTSPFSEGSQVKTDWNKGSRVLFLDGKGDGMISEIADKVPNEFMSFRHIGITSNGKRILKRLRQKGGRVR